MVINVYIHVGEWWVMMINGNLMFLNGDECLLMRIPTTIFWVVDSMTVTFLVLPETDWYTAAASNKGKASLVLKSWKHQAMNVDDLRFWKGSTAASYPCFKPPGLQISVPQCDCVQNVLKLQEALLGEKLRGSCHELFNQRAGSVVSCVHQGT